MSSMFFSGVAVDQNIINVYGAKNIQVVSQSVIDVVLKRRQCISKIKILMFREAIGQKMENAYIVLCKLDLDIKYIGKQLGYTTSMT